jgi:4'-phosphopantetheinyl transferase
MDEVRYTIQDWDQVPDSLHWLTFHERARYEGFRFDKRRRDWLLGRWAAKIALLGVSGLPERDIKRFEIASAPNGAPLPRLDGRPYQARLSLSHSNNRAFSTVSAGTRALGCDIELVEPRSEVFVETYFTESERVHVERTSPLFRDSLVTKIWSAKESTLKALRTGLQADTRSVEVIDNGDCAGADWDIARTIVADAGEFSCLWRLDGQFVLSIVTRDPVETPIPVADHRSARTLGRRQFVARPP